MKFQLIVLCALSVLFTSFAQDFSAIDDSHSSVVPIDNSRINATNQTNTQPLCWGFEGTISTAAKTPYRWVVEIYDPNTSSLIDSFQDAFEFPTPDSFDTWGNCDYTTVDIFVFAYNSNNHELGRHIMRNVDLYAGGSSPIWIDFYCE